MKDQPPLSTVMNKTELIKAIAHLEQRSQREPLTINEVNRVVNRLLQLMTQILTQPGSRVEFENFAVFEVYRIEVSKTGILRRGQTGAAGHASAIRHHIRMKPSNALKQKLRANIAETKQTR